MDRNEVFDQQFGQKFSDGLTNIKFFVNPNRKVSADEIRDDAIAFQGAIDAGRVSEINAVD